MRNELVKVVIILLLVSCGGGGSGGSGDGGPDNNQSTDINVPANPFVTESDNVIDEANPFLSESFSDAEAVINNSGKILVTYNSSGTLTAGYFDGTTWLEPVKFNAPYEPWTAKSHRIVLNDAGYGAVVFRASDDPETSARRFGIAYFNGSSWSYVGVMEGRVDYKIGYGYNSHSFGATGSGIAVVSSSGVVFVTYTASSGKVAVARFDSNGFVDSTEFETSSLSYLAIDDSDHVMLLVCGVGSRIWNGSMWSDLVSFTTSSGDLNASLHFQGDSADYVTLYGPSFNHYHFDGVSWDLVGSASTGYSVQWGSFARNGAGNAMVSGIFDVDTVVTSYFDGSSWSLPDVIETAGSSVQRSYVFESSSGRFVMVDLPTSVLLNGGVEYYSRSLRYFDGQWRGPFELQKLGMPLAVAGNRQGELVFVGVAFNWDTYLSEFRAQRLKLN